MRIGTLVKYGFNFGIVVGWWTHKISEEEHTLVCWLTGTYTGDTDAVMGYDLEVLCE
jgi:hypothetical protein